jgi:hypothetical protein
MGQEPRDYTPYQQQLIRRYYEQEPTRLRQRLAELVSELYLADGKKRERLWGQVAKMLPKLGLGPVRIQHILEQRKPEMLASLVTELQSR